MDLYVVVTLALKMDPAPSDLMPSGLLPPGCSYISRDTMVLTSHILAHKITVLEYKFNDS